MENIATIKVALCRHKTETTKCPYCSKFKFGGDGAIGVISQNFSIMTLNNEESSKMTPKTPSTPLFLNRLLERKTNQNEFISLNTGNVVQ